MYILVNIVYLDCWNSLPQSRWFINNIHLFLIALLAWKSKIKALVDSLSGESLLFVSQMACVYWDLVVEETLFLFIRSLILSCVDEALIAWSPTEGLTS